MYTVLYTWELADLHRQGEWDRYPTPLVVYVGTREFSRGGQGILRGAINLINGVQHS
jgi:hypothetical protein